MAHGHGGARKGAGQSPGTPNSRETAKIVKDLVGAVRIGGRRGPLVRRRRIQSATNRRCAGS